MRREIPYTTIYNVQLIEDLGVTYEWITPWSDEIEVQINGMVWTIEDIPDSAERFMVAVCNEGFEITFNDGAKDIGSMILSDDGQITITSTICE